MSANESDKGIKVMAASSGVDETMDRLENLAKKRGLTVFARINFAKDAAAAGLEHAADAAVDSRQPGRGDAADGGRAGDGVGSAAQGARLA